jgi:hypothetical protein
MGKPKTPVIELPDSGPPPTVPNLVKGNPINGSERPGPRGLLIVEPHRKRPRRFRQRNRHRGQTGATKTELQPGPLHAVLIGAPTARSAITGYRISRYSVPQPTRNQGTCPHCRRGFTQILTS